MAAFAGTPHVTSNDMWNAARRNDVDFRSQTPCHALKTFLGGRLQCAMITWVRSRERSRERSRRLGRGAHQSKINQLIDAEPRPQRSAEVQQVAALWSRGPRWAAPARPSA